jgi:hypothetical protein
MTWLAKFVVQCPQTQSELESTPWYEFNSYVDACASLGRPVSVTGWCRYRQYYVPG